MSRDIGDMHVVDHVLAVLRRDGHEAVYRSVDSLASRVLAPWMMALIRSLLRPGGSGSLGSATSPDPS